MGVASSNISPQDPEYPDQAQPQCNSQRQPLFKLNLQNFFENLSGRSSFTGVSSFRSAHSNSSRPLSKFSRRRWNNSTLSDPYLCSKSTWPVPRSEVLFLPQFKVGDSSLKEKFSLIETISKGAFGKVYKVLDTSEKTVYALKVLSKSQIVSENAIQQVKEEVHIQEVCGHHPFIVGCPLKWQNKKKLFIATDFVPGGELSFLLEAYPKLHEEVVKIYIAEVALVLDFLHNAGIIYRDLKPENILLDKAGHIQLIDFGLSKWLKIGFRTKTLCGTIKYIAPEVLKGDSYGHAVDWWALGIIMLRMLTDSYPPSEGIKEKPPELSENAYKLIIRLLEANPLYRLRSLKSIQETAFFKDYNFSDVKAMKNAPNDILKKYHNSDEAGPSSQNVQHVFEDFEHSNVDLIEKFNVLTI